MNTGLFLPDPSNIGGRTTIRKQLKDHHSALLKVKPMVKTLVPPRAHVDANKRSKTRDASKYRVGEFVEVVVSFKKVVGMKQGYIDHQKPETFDMLKSPGKKNAKREAFINTEHTRELKSQQDRIRRIGTLMHERKKNEFDPIAHPPILFKKNIPKKPDDVDFMFSKVSITRHKAEKVELKGLKKKLQDQPKPNLTTQGSSAGSPNKTIDEKEDDEIPLCDSEDAADFDKLKEKIIALIMEKHLIKNSDIKKLTDRVSAKNKHLDQEKLKKLYIEIQKELDD